MRTVDLHGIKHENVGSLLDSVIWECMKKDISSIKIITGNSSEMKKIVNEIAYEYGFIVEDSIINSGIVTMNMI